MTTRPLRVGVVGCGNIARRLHVPIWLAHPEAGRIVGVADPDPGARERVRALAGLPAGSAHADSAELLARADVDAVDVCTPPHLRRDLLVAAARAGKHILCEKPIATVPADAAAAVEAADAAGVTLAMVHNFLWLPEIRAAREVIDSGRIGAVRTVIVNFLGITYVPGAAGDWRKDPELAGGGVAMDMVHATYLAEHLAGERLERASAYVAGGDPTMRVEGTALCRYETATRVCLVNIAWGNGPGGIEIAGDAGRVSIRYRDGATAPWAPRESVTVSTADGTDLLLGPEAPRPAEYDEFPPLFDAFPGLVLDFVAAATGTGRPHASGADGLRALEATLAAYESGATGRTVPIPLDRADPVFGRGALGVPLHDGPDWSPVRRGGLYGPA